MHVALTGASGFIGSYIAKELKAKDHTVAGLVRATSRRDHVEPFVDRFVEGDQVDDSAWPHLLEDADCVIHNSVNWNPLRAKEDGLREHLESNLNASIRLLHAAAPRQFIFISTVAVHHDMRPRWRGVIDEDHPLRPSSLYGAYKAAVEAHLWAAHYSTGRHTCAFRPCGVYGIDPNLERSYGLNLLRKAKEGRGPLSKPGGGKFVHVQDVAAAVAAAIGNDRAIAQPFNLVDCYARWADWARMACEIIGRTDLEIDFSSPAEPKNTFSKAAVQQTLGVSMDRGHEGIRDHLRELAAHL